jgi:GntR family transcriptional repressor for pyruvate dehydrogenase complex
MATDLGSIELSRREGLPHEIARKLIDYLLSGDIKPGARMPSERALAAALGVGRSAVREALKSLGLLGLIEVRQGDGTYLRKPDSDLLPQVIEWGLLLGERRTLDLVDARQQLEIMVAGLAAERRDAADLRQLTLALKAMSRRGNAAAFIEADISFHLAVAEAAHNAVLLDVLNSVRSLLRVWIRRSIAQAGETRGSHLEHVPILDAIVAGDTTAATAAMSTHMAAAALRLRRSIDAETTNRADGHDEMVEGFGS